jgi:hypothetical protein
MAADVPAELAALADELGVEPDALGFLTEHAPRDVARLSELVRGARARQDEELRVAFDRTLEHVPRLLRGQVRKLLMGRA